MIHDSTEEDEIFFVAFVAGVKEYCSSFEIDKEKKSETHKVESTCAYLELLLPSCSFMISSNFYRKTFEIEWKWKKNIFFSCVCLLAAQLPYSFENWIIKLLWMIRESFSIIFIFFTKYSQKFFFLFLKGTTDYNWSLSIYISSTDNTGPRTVSINSTVPCECKKITADFGKSIRLVLLLSTPHIRRATTLTYVRIF